MNRENWTGLLTFAPLETWRGFLAAIVLGTLGVTGLDYMSGKRIPGAEQGLTSLQHGVLLTGGALASGAALWLCIRFFRGSADAPEPKEFVLWCACIAGVVITALRMF